MAVSFSLVTRNESETIKRKNKQIKLEAIISIAVSSLHEKEVIPNLYRRMVSSVHEKNF
jgi:hypothetical protein